MMIRNLKSILILMIIILMFYLIAAGFAFWGIFLLFVLITYIYNSELLKINNEFNWIAASLMNDNELRNARESKVIYFYALNCLFDQKIKKGMTIEEFAKILYNRTKEAGIKLVGHKSVFLKTRAEGTVKYDVKDENYTLVYLDHGSPIPTPELRFKFKKGILVKIQRITN